MYMQAETPQNQRHITSPRWSLLKLLTYSTTTEKTSTNQLQLHNSPPQFGSGKFYTVICVKEWYVIDVSPRHFKVVVKFQVLTLGTVIAMAITSQSLDLWEVIDRKSIKFYCKILWHTIWAKIFQISPTSTRSWERLYVPKLSSNIYT